MAKSKRKGTNPKKFDLTTPVVKALIEFDALPHELLPDEYNTQEKFLKKFNLKTRQSFYNYRQIKGYSEALAAKKEEYKPMLIATAVKGLYKLAAGAEQKKTNIKKVNGIEVERVESTTTIMPSAEACKTILTVIGDMREKHAHDVTSAGVSIFREAAEAEKRGGDKNG